MYVDGPYHKVVNRQKLLSKEMVAQHGRATETLT